MSWKKYYQNSRDKPVSKLLKKVVKDISSGEALDLGCGRGKDSLFLISNGFMVTAIDSDKSVKDFLFSELVNSDDFKFINEKIEDFNFQEEIYDIINAQLIFPYIHKTKLRQCFKDIISSLKPGGILVGQFFGVNDSWNSKYTSRTFFELGEVEELFKDFKVSFLEEVEGFGYDVFSQWKYWHIFHFIIKK